MSFPAPALFSGDVVHKRVFPVRHRLRYRVFSVFVNVEDIGALTRRSRFFSHNRWNLLSLYDRDHGDGRKEGPGRFVRRLVARHLDEDRIAEIRMLAFPRVLGYVFNPLTTYFCLDRHGALLALVYEVNNTFGGRTHYVCGVTRHGDVLHVEPVEKHMAVSPFNEDIGQYGFRLRHDRHSLVIGVSLRQRQRPILNTWYAAERRPVTDAQILSLLARMPLMTFKVIAAIHLEAARLWLKGLRPKSRPRLSKPPLGISCQMRRPAPGTSRRAG